MIGVLTLAIGLTLANPTYVRLETIAPIKEETWWEKVAEFLGVRGVARKKLPVGTKIIVSATGYASSPYQTDSTPCITAAGTVVRQGVVASNSLAMGTILDINSDLFIVEDRMNSRYRGHYLDIWFPATSQALEFGRRRLEITVVGHGEPGQLLTSPTPVVASSPNVPDPDTLVIRTEKDFAPVVARAAKSWWQRLLENIGARLTGDVDRFDVKCEHP